MNPAGEDACFCQGLVQSCSFYTRISIMYLCSLSVLQVLLPATLTVLQINNIEASSQPVHGQLHLLFNPPWASQISCTGQSRQRDSLPVSCIKASSPLTLGGSRFYESHLKQNPVLKKNQPNSALQSGTSQILVLLFQSQHAVQKMQHH